MLKWRPQPEDDDEEPNIDGEDERKAKCKGASGGNVEMNDA